MIQRQFDVIINESEIVYLAIHIHHFEAQIKNRIICNVYYSIVFG